jgi:multidrug resistance efflux pump
VAEIYVGGTDSVSKGAPIFRLDSSKQEAAVESARRKITEIEAETLVAQAEIAKTEGQIQEAKSAHQQTLDELETKRELQRRNPGNVAFRDIQKLEVNLVGRQGAITAATAAKQEAEERIATLLPAQKASAEAALAEAQVELQKTVVRAGVDGRGLDRLGGSSFGRCLSCEHHRRYQNRQSSDGQDAQPPVKDAPPPAHIGQPPT